MKNIVLAGMNVTIQDSSLVSIEDLNYNFFVGLDDFGRNVRSSISMYIFVFIVEYYIRTCFVLFNTLMDVCIVHSCGGTDIYVCIYVCMHVCMYLLYLC